MKSADLEVGRFPVEPVIGKAVLITYSIRPRALCWELLACVYSATVFPQVVLGMLSLQNRTGGFSQLQADALVPKISRRQHVL